MIQISREQISRPSQQLSLTTQSATTPEIAIEGFAGAGICIPAGSPITTLTFYVSNRSSAAQVSLPTVNQAPTFYGLHTNDNNDTAETLTVSADHAYAIPADIYPFGSMKIVANAAGAVELSLKG